MLDRHTDRGIKSFANKPNVYVLVKFVEIMTAFAQVSMHGLSARRQLPLSWRLRLWNAQSTKNDLE